jgi:hypothetical protein
MKWTSWLALVVLLAVGTFVVYSSFTVSGVRCEVCMEFDGHRACRTVDGATEDETLAAARTNSCALLASGVTDTMACERTPPAHARCTPL